MSDKVIISRVLNAVLMQETIPQGTYMCVFTLTTDLINIIKMTRQALNITSSMITLTLSV